MLFNQKLIVLFVLAISVLLIIPNSFALDLNDTDISDSIVADENSIYVSTSGNDNGAGTQQSPYKTISHAIDAFNSTKNSNIYVGNGIYNITSQININKDIIIIGESKDGVILNANNQNSIFKITKKSSIIFNSLSFENAYDLSATQYTASAIYVNNDINSLLIDNCIFKNNNNGTIAAYDYFATGTITIQNSLFSNNKKILSTNGHGAAIYINGKYKLNVFNTTFENNYANSTRDASWPSDGGAVYLSGNVNSSVFDNCKFINNSARSSSSIGANNGGNVTIINCEFRENVAGKDGYLIYDAGGNKLTLNLGNNVFADNQPDTIYTSDNIHINYLEGNTRLESKDVSMLEGQDKTFNIKLSDDKGNPIGGKEIIITLTNYYNEITTFNPITNNSGIALINLKNQKFGKYDVLSVFAGDSEYDSRNISNTIYISTESDYNMIFNPAYVKMYEGQGFEVTGIITDNYGVPDYTFNNAQYEIRWFNHEGTISVIQGTYHIDGYNFTYDLSRCHLVSRDELYYINFTAASKSLDYSVTIAGSLPVDLSVNVPTINPDADVIWVSQGGSDETGDGSEDNPLASVQMALYVNKVLGGGKTIHIKEGQYNISIYNLNDEVTIIGEGSKTVLSQDTGRLGMFSIYGGNKVSFINLSFTNGFATPVPSSLITATENSLVYIDGCEFYKNYAIRGGAISIDNANVYIKNSYFHDNAALLQASQGGAIWITSGVLSVINSKFEDNEATLGGAIYSSYDADTYILNSTFINNTAIATSLTYGGGGAIFTQSSVETVIENSTFLDNYAELYGGAIYVYGGITDITRCYFEDNAVGFGSDKGNTIHVLPLASTIKLNVSYSIFFNDDDYNRIIYVDELEDDNESSFEFENNYWGGQQKAFVSVNKAVTKWVIIQTNRDTSLINKGDVVKITSEFKSTDINGTMYDLTFPIHDLVLYLSPNIGEVNPNEIILSNNIAEFNYYANEYGSEYINFTSDYARHFIYSFNIIDSSKVDLNANVTITSGKTTIIDVEVPKDIENNITISIGDETSSIKASNGHATLTLNVRPGNYTVVVNYLGDNKYKSYVNESKITVNKYLSKVSIDVPTIRFGDLLEVNVNVTEGATGDVIITIEDTNYTIELNNSKGSKYIHNILAGTHIIYAKYMGDAYYDESTSQASFNVLESIPITTLYVSTDGSDTNGNGSINNKYATISKALDRNSAWGGGKTIIISKGTYILNRYSITDDVTIIGEGNVVILSNTNTNHLYIGGNVNVVLKGLTFANGNGYTSGSIDMGSSHDNTLKNLTIINCTFIDNQGPVGAIISYANTKIIQTNFINNTATGSSGSVQAIINIRDNTLDISYSNFINNKISGSLLVYSAVNGLANYNFWGNNLKPADDLVSNKLTKDIWVVIIPFVNDSDIVSKHIYTVSAKFKSTNDALTFNDLVNAMPDINIKLSGKIGRLSPSDITLHNNVANTSYISYSLGNEVIDVYVINNKVNNLTFIINIPEEDKIYVDVNGNNANNGTENNPLQTITSAIAQNKASGGNKTIIVREGIFSESDLIIDDEVNMIGEKGAIIKANSLTVNKDTSITNLIFENTKIIHKTNDLTIYSSEFINSFIKSAGDNLIIYDSIFDGDAISTNANTIITNATFKNINSNALTIENNADITDSHFENNNVAIDAKSGIINIKHNEFTSNNDVILINTQTTIDNNIFKDNNPSTAVIYANNNAIITNNRFNEENMLYINNANINAENNTGGKIKLVNGSITNAVIKFINAKTIKVNGGVITLNASVYDDSGNIIDGGSIEFTSNGIKIGESNIKDSIATFNYRFESGEYTISGASSNFPKSKVYSGVLRVDVINYWFIGDVGYETLSEAVDASKNGDVIRGVAGTYIINEIDIGHRYRPSEPFSLNKTITITSLNETPLTLEANGRRIFYIDTSSKLTVKNIVFANSHNDGDIGFGGVIDVFIGGELNVDNCTFVNNSADQGGAIYSFGTTTISNSIFENNIAGLTGGAIFKDGYGDLVIENTTFKNSYASSFGGAVHLLGYDNTDNYIINSKFINNTGFRGGALYAGGANLTVIDCDFISNNALRIHEDYEDEDAIGGAFYNYYANVEFFNSNFINNYAQDCGGAMELDNTVTSIGSYYNPTVTIYFTGIDNCTFINNTADDGGAIYMGYAGAPFVLISHSLFDGNTALYDAAAIGNVAGFLSLTNTEFINNNAGSDNLIYIYGTDDLYNEYDAYIFMDNCTFKSNNVNFDIYVANMYSFGEIFNSTFIGESTVLSNRGFINVTNTIIKDSINPSKYLINNFGLLGLENNTFDKPIFSDFYISTPTYIVVLNNETQIAVINDTFVLTAVVVDDNGNQIEGCDLIFIVDGVEINGTLKDHVFTAQYSVESGPHVVSANYSDTGLQNLTVKTAMIIAKNPTLMNVSAEDIVEGEDAVINIALSDDATGVVIVTIDNEKYNVSVDNGKAIVIISNLTFGNKTVNVTYLGDDNYPPTSKKISLYVEDVKKVNLIVVDVKKYYKGSERFRVTLTDVYNNLLANQNVSILLNGITYTKKTNSNGTTTFPLGLNSGIYEVIAYYNGSDIYSKASSTAKVIIKDTINASDVTKVYRNATQYSAIFLDSQGNPLANGVQVTFNINGVFYKRNISSEGRAKLNLNLEQGTYILTAMNPVTGENHVNTVIIIPRIVENNDVVKYYRNATKYVVRILGDDGNPVGKGENVTFNINGVFYTRQTNDEGYARLNLNLQPGLYIITAEYKGCRASNSIEVLPVLSADDIQMNYRDGTQFEAKLVDGHGNPYAGQGVQFNINGVIYIRYTNGDGIAHLNINLMPGEYIITSSYNASNIANTIKIS